jgi:nitric oxide synthase oxygenase domain/subunit
LLNNLDLDNINSFDDVVDAIDNEGLFNVEIIYYASAMDYLRENDPSLQECMRIASEFGYETGRLNSELLASLLASETVRDEFYEYQNSIEEFFNELEEDQEDEDDVTSMLYSVDNNQ